MSLNSPREACAEDVPRLRDDYIKKRDSTRLVSGRRVLDTSIDRVDDIAYHTYWYHDGRPQGQCIQLADIPGTLSGDILRLRQGLPSLEGDHTIVGNHVRPLQNTPKLPEPYEEDDDSEDLTATLGSLPTVKVNPDKHFVKKGKYESEIKNLLKCQGGYCPGVPLSPYIIQLLGKSPDGELVFEKFNRAYIPAEVVSLSFCKRWILQLIAGLEYLHSRGIVHRDLRMDNLLISPNFERLLICDLEGRWGNRLAPEISRGSDLNAGWTEKSDIYDLGLVIRGIVYANNPITSLVERPLPSLIEAIAEGCTRNLPQDRPSLKDLHDMVDAIQLSASGESPN